MQNIKQKLFNYFMYNFLSIIIILINNKLLKIIIINLFKMVDKAEIDSGKKIELMTELLALGIIKPKLSSLRSKAR